MLRFQLRGKFNNNKSEKNYKYKQQRNYCVKFYVKQKWNTLIKWTLVRSAAAGQDNKMIWKTVKPRFSNKWKTAKRLQKMESS